MAGAVRSAWHSVVAGRIQGWFEASGHTAIREIGVVLGAGDVSTPDIAVFHPGELDLTATEFRPDLIACVVEVVSRDTRERDREIKPARYAGAGIIQFWLVEERPDQSNDALIQVFDLVRDEQGARYEQVRTVALTELEQEFA